MKRDFDTDERTAVTMIVKLAMNEMDSQFSKQMTGLRGDMSQKFSALDLKIAAMDSTIDKRIAACAHARDSRFEKNNKWKKTTAISLIAIAVPTAIAIIAFFVR